MITITKTTGIKTHPFMSKELTVAVMMREAVRAESVRLASTKPVDWAARHKMFEVYCFWRDMVQASAAKSILQNQVRGLFHAQANSNKR